MKTFYLSAVFLIALTVLYQEASAQLQGCTDDQSCTDLCGFQGEGKCVNKKYCSCADCPMRSIYELASFPKICTLDPTCICPAPVFSLSSGKIYTGHRCIQNMKLVCICFCLPTNPMALVNVIKCPFTNNTVTTTAAPN